MRAAQGGTNAMFDEMKRGFRAAAISLVLCMPLVSSLARADDCRDALIAESCACQSSEREQRSASDQSSPGKKESKARKSMKVRIAQGSTPSTVANENGVAER